MRGRRALSRPGFPVRSVRRNENILGFRCVTGHQVIARLAVEKDPIRRPGKARREKRLAFSANARTMAGLMTPCLVRALQ